MFDLFDLDLLRDKPVVLFGAGNEGVHAAGILRGHGITPLCFCDNYKEGEKAGLEIIPLNKVLAGWPDAKILITAIGYADEIISTLKDSGVREGDIITEFRAHLYEQPYLAYFELNIVDHCNISCLGCSHFSPIAEERCWPADTIKHDLRRMSELTAQRVDEIHILGGEPLLHPDLCEILRQARLVFPHSVLSVITNGVLLVKQDGNFWRVCRENDITLEVTKYPMPVDYDKIARTAEEKNVAFKFHSYTGKAQKTLYKMPMDTSGRQDPAVSFSGCTLANRWTAVMDGKMYTCQVAPNAYHFNKRFNAGMELEAGDYIDIHDAGNIGEVLSFLSTPKPFCRYCRIDGIENNLPWQPSKKEMSEWV